jgi:hypothetical protein
MAFDARLGISGHENRLQSVTEALCNLAIASTYLPKIEDAFCREQPLRHFSRCRLRGHFAKPGVAVSYLDNESFHRHPSLKPLLEQCLQMLGFHFEVLVLSVANYNDEKFSLGIG